MRTLKLTFREVDYSPDTAAAMSYAMVKPPQARPMTTPSAPAFLTDVEEQEVVRKKRGPVVPKSLMLSRSTVIDEMAAQPRKVQLTPLPTSSSGSPSS